MMTDIKIPTDEELARIWREAAFSAQTREPAISWEALSDSVRHVWSEQICAVRAAVEAPLRAEIARLEDACDCSARSEETYRQLWLARERECESLRAEIAEAKHMNAVRNVCKNAAWFKTTSTRPVRVRFDCTAEELAAQLCFSLDVMQSAHTALDYLATRAVIDVPDTVPTAIELRRAYIEWCWERKNKGEDSSGKPEAIWIYERLTPYLQQPASEPIASAETLEQLARIGQRVMFPSPQHPMWEVLSKTQQQAWIAAVTAILRAAKPVIDATRDDISQKSAHEHSRDFFKWLNSRIRFTVAVPAEPRTDDLRAQQRECYERVYEAGINSMPIDELCDSHKATAHLIALEAAHTLPSRLAELEAVLKGGE